jgi:hypothetical protein
MTRDEEECVEIDDIAWQGKSKYSEKTTYKTTACGNIWKQQKLRCFLKNAETV